jgi:hypothetical protein
MEATAGPCHSMLHVSLSNISHFWGRPAACSIRSSAACRTAASQRRAKSARTWSGATSPSSERCAAPSMLGWSICARIAADRWRTAKAVLETTATMRGTDLLAAMRIAAADTFAPPARREGRIGIGNRCSRSQSEAPMIAPLALAIGATAPVLPAAAHLEVSATFARTAVAERLPRAPESPAPLHHARRGHA